MQSWLFEKNSKIEKHLEKWLRRKYKLRRISSWLGIGKTGTNKYIQINLTSLKLGNSIQQKYIECKNTRHR